MYHLSSTTDSGQIGCCTAAPVRSFQCHKKPDQIQRQHHVRLHKTTTASDVGEQYPTTGPYRFVVVDKQQQAASRGNNVNQTVSGELAARRSYAQSYRRKSLCTFTATDVHQAILTNNIVPAKGHCLMNGYGRGSPPRRHSDGAVVGGYDHGIGNAAAAITGNSDRGRERGSISTSNGNGHLSDNSSASPGNVAATSIIKDGGQAGEELRQPFEGQVSSRHTNHPAEQAKRYMSNSSIKLCPNQLSRSAVETNAAGREEASYTDHEGDYNGDTKLSSQAACRGWRMGWNMKPASCAQSYVASSIDAAGTGANIETKPKLSSAESDSGRRGQSNCIRQIETAAPTVKNHHQSSLPASLQSDSVQLSSSSPSLPKLLDRISVWRPKGKSNDTLSQSGREAAITCEYNSPPTSSLIDTVRHRGASSSKLSSSPNIAQRSHGRLDHQNKSIEEPNYYHSKIQIKSRPAASKLSDRMHSVHSLSMQLDQASIRQMHCDPSDLAGVASLAAHSAPQSPAISQSVLNSLNAEQLAQNQSAANKIGRIVGKKASRLKEIVLQNLGRADKTTDELFELYEENFFKQHTKTSKLSKEFKNYMNALKGKYRCRAASHRERIVR